MYLQLVREDEGEKATEGLLLLNGTSECFTLEDKDRKLEDGGEKVYGETCIPRGTYEVVLDMSTRFKKVLPRLLNVPQFRGVRIHPGNTSEDTEGCILVGAKKVEGNDDFIGESRIAFDRLMTKLETADRITIEIV